MQGFAKPVIGIVGDSVHVYCFAAIATYIKNHLILLGKQLFTGTYAPTSMFPETAKFFVELESFYSYSGLSAENIQRMRELYDDQFVAQTDAGDGVYRSVIFGSRRNTPQEDTSGFGTAASAFKKAVLPDGRSGC